MNPSQMLDEHAAYMAGHHLSLDQANYGLAQTIPADSSGYVQPHQLRNHRSASSITSTNSSLGWTTDFNSSPPASEGSEYDFGAASKVPRTSNGSGVGLSIDPKLFQPKPRITSSDSDLRGDDEEGMMTAKPPKPPRARARKGANGEKKVSHARKQHPDHIPRPRNAFILFRKHVVDSKLIPASVEMRHQNVSIITAKMWAEASTEQKAHFNDLAKIEKEEHMKKYPGYRYQPVYRRTNVIRRRVRKDDAEEEKCQAVAELLVKGKSGAELETVIREKARASSGTSTPQLKERSGRSRKNSGAVALSKGAIRALRAQVRQPSVSDWSDLSRSNSVAPAEDEIPFEIEPEMTQHVFGSELFHDQGAASTRFQETTFVEPPPLFQHPSIGFNSWSSNGADPAFSFPSNAQIQPYAYPQPIQNSFYAYDQALPFSPSAHLTTFSQQQIIPTDLMFPSVGGTLSPTAPLYPPVDAFSLAAEGMLDDFGTALAQADELHSW